jgi:hypothetical protein
LGKLGENISPGKIFTEARQKLYETTAAKKPATPIALRKKRE